MTLNAAADCASMSSVPAGHRPNMQEADTAVDYYGSDDHGQHGTSAVQQLVQQRARVTAILGSRRHMRQAARFDREQGRAGSLHPDGPAALVTYTCGRQRTIQAISEPGYEIKIGR